MSNELQNQSNNSNTKSLVVRFADRYGVEGSKLMDTLKNTAFSTGRGKPEVSNQQMMALLVVADQYNLNPFTREIYAFPQNGGIVPIVGVDGWSRIINEHPHLDGVTFTLAEETTEFAGKDVPLWCECTIHRKDREVPTTVREYFREVSRDTGPWQSHPTRMLRHKTLIQCSRVAFGYTGIYDEDEAQRIKDVTPKTDAGQSIADALDDPIIDVDDDYSMEDYAVDEAPEHEEGS